jgi:integrase
MPTYPGRAKGTRRVVISVAGKPKEWIVRGGKKDAEAFEARKRLELEVGTLSKRTAPELFGFCEKQYKPYAETNLKPSTWKNSRRYQLATLMAFFRGSRLTSITTEEVERYKRDRLKDVGRTSVNNETRLLGTVLRYARDLGYPCATPKIKRLKPLGEGRVRTWTQDEVGRLFEESRKEPGELARILIFLANTGCRKGEALAAEWDWMDFESEMIRIPSNAYWQPKNGLPREIPMSDRCRAILSMPRASDRWVFPNMWKGRYTVFPKQLFLAARKRAKLKGGVHTLRHTFASVFLKNVPDLFLLSQVLGHSHERVTELYAHLLPEHLARARNAVNLGPTLKTMVPTMAKAKKTQNLPRKTGTRP